MNIHLTSISLAAALALGASGVAMAQTEQDTSMTADQSSMAKQCLADLDGLRQKMQSDGYDLASYGYDYGAGTGMTGTMPPPPAENTTAAGATPPATAGQAAGVATPADVGPYGQLGWQENPQTQLRTLYQAANVLARNGKQDACESVVQATQTIYTGYIAQMEKLGIKPDQVTGWRQQQILAAKPVAQMTQRIRTDQLIGTNVRNAQDESLGEVENVVMDPQSGMIRYAVVAAGGFLGIGEERVLVPWSQMRATPNYGSLILPVSENALEAAPKYQSNEANSGDVASVDQYWIKALGDKAVQQQ